ncbi:hypothetical protein ABPG72_015897 [Tetrahymena utriculariae]
MQGLKLPYQKHADEDEETSPQNGQIVNNENHETNRSCIIEDNQKKMETQFNQSYMVTYTQGNMTTNSNNISISKVDLNQIQGRYKSANKQPSQDINEFVMDNNSLQNNEDNRNDNNQIIPLEIQNEMKDYHTKNQNGKQQQNSKKAAKQLQYKKRQADLHIEIPNSDEERKAKQDAYNKMVLQQQMIMQNGNGNSSNRRQLNQDKEKKGEGMENQESARVNDIIKNNQIDVENLETIQIDYDFETIEGLTDDQCLELYCEGSVKLKNQSRLFCKLAYEHLLVEKIRATTRLAYTNLGIVNNGNLNSSDFISECIVQPLKRENIKFRTQDISEAFTVQCSDYIHFNIKKQISRAVRLFIVLSIIMLISFILKIQDPAYEKDVTLQICFILLGLSQFASTYFYISGIYVCSNEYIRKGIFLNQVYFFFCIGQFIYESITLNYFSQIASNTLQTRTNFKQVIYYYSSFIISFIVCPYLYKINKKTTSAVRRIIKIVSDEYID